MSVEGGHGPAEFRPVKLGSRRRRVDPLGFGVVVVVAALLLAVVKPWDAPDPAVTSLASPTTTAMTDPTRSPVASVRDPLTPPTWSDVAPAVTRRSMWGVRTIVPVDGPAADTPDPDRFAERWYPAEEDAGEEATAVVHGRDGAIVALGVTFPPEETPLDVRVWLDHTGGELEWMDVLPIDDSPARGAFLYVRRDEPGAAVRPWAAGRYRLDILVGEGVRRIDVHVTDPTGRLPDPEPWVHAAPRDSVVDTAALRTLPQGLFIQAGGETIPIPSRSGPVLDERAAWLDLDRDVPGEGPRSFVASIHQPDLTQVGVRLPDYSAVQTSAVKRLSPAGDTTGGVRRTATVSIGAASFVAFAPGRQPGWRPGVYALTVAWEDSDGSHERTWHIELRPGPVPATPILLAATRAWTRFIGSTGVLLGVAEPLSGTDPLGVTLLDITPQTEPGYPGLSGSDLIGCGETIVLGRPEVIGIVGDPDADLSPVSARMQYPFTNNGPVGLLTAAGVVPGLTLVTPLLTAELQGPAAYGFRVGTAGDTPFYTICIGLTAGG